MPGTNQALKGRNMSDRGNALGIVADILIRLDSATTESVKWLTADYRGPMLGRVCLMFFSFGIVQGGIMAAIGELEPKKVWQHFENLCNIPRTSRNEAKAIEYIENWAKNKGLDYKKDSAGNIVVYVPGSKGKENAPIVVLQGHVDMVGEKNKDVDHDFEKDPIQAVIDGDWVHAKGTTLGADNGIGVSAALAVAEEDFEHGPLELVFTIDEETGLTGASNLDTSLIHGMIMLNLDSEEDGIFYVGCAGGGDTDLAIPVTSRPAPDDLAYEKIVVRGLKGGHSGCDIHENRANAIKVLARILAALRDVPIEIAAMEGGGKHNAIPREAEAIVALPASDNDDVLGIVERQMAGLLDEYGPKETGMEVTASKIEGERPLTVLDKASRDKVINTLLALPHGIAAMSRDIPGLVETSTNLATIKLEQGELKILTSSRSSIESALEALRQQIEAVAWLAGGKAMQGNKYPGWKPNMNSVLLARATDVFKEMFNKEPRVTAIHAGLECGIIGDRIGGMDMLSFGPDVQNPHSPDERTRISSVDRFWRFLKTLLQQLAA